MKWQGRRTSRNIEDRRRGGGARAGGLGGLGLLAVLAIGYFLGVDVTPLLEQQTAPTNQTTELTEADQRAGQFVSVVLADTEEVWADIFARQLDRPYRPATLVLFKGTTQSPCGGASGATGPFYCPADRKAYLDTGFFTTMERQLGAGGDFAAAYVVAHEIAHHVQNELGVLRKAHELRLKQTSRAKANAITVRIELQADCFSGVWARHAQARFGALEPGDLQEALNAAKQIGDDTLQRNAGRVPMPHTFTHGTSAQRQSWFAKGYDSGSVEICDTFSPRTL